MDLVFYVGDIETTGLDSHKHDIIELSLLRIGDTSDDCQRTWCFKPLSPENIDMVALKINGHKLEDIMHKTKEGRERYLDAKSTLVDIENWLANDDVPPEKRFLVGHNIAFDKERLQIFWEKCESGDSFPFGRRMMDTMENALFFDYCLGQFAEGYSLANLNKKYSVKNEKAHTAAADVKATKEVFEKQVEQMKKLIKLGKEHGIL